MQFGMKEYMTYQYKLDKYLDMFGSYYTKRELEYISEAFLDPYEPIRHHGDLLNQIYQLIGVFDVEKDNTYEIFRDAMVKRMDINRDILEVGCGRYPSFAESIANMQSHGSVTAVDSKVVTTDVPGVKVIKARFDANFDVDRYDMIYGLYPCSATTDMIKLANLKDKDLCLLACDCGHISNDPEVEEVIEDKKLWLKFIRRYIKESLPSGRTYKIEHIKSIDAPLITTRKLK